LNNLEVNLAQFVLFHSGTPTALLSAWRIVPLSSLSQQVRQLGDIRRDFAAPIAPAEVGLLLLLFWRGVGRRRSNGGPGVVLPCSLGNLLGRRFVGVVKFFLLLLFFRRERRFLCPPQQINRRQRLCGSVCGH